MSLIHKQIKLETYEIEREMYVRWFTWHNGNLELISVVSGISLRTVQRWKKARRIPRKYAVLIDQIEHGRIIQCNPMRGAIAIRSDRCKHRPVTGSDLKRPEELLTRSRQGFFEGRSTGGNSVDLGLRQRAATELRAIRVIRRG